MGSSASKPAGDQSSYVWKPSGPVGVSHDVANSLQSSSETDTSRTQNLELAIQARVAAELKKATASVDAKLRAAAAEAAAAVRAEREREAAAAANTSEVSAEIETLRRRLDGRKTIRELPAEVEGARQGVVRCLLEHDRRPLDCWAEVEAFREQVRRLERGWVEKVVS
ncbi:DUF1690-domain-containing protein [Xylariomycetidae sp. FL0641]|nr:DUF1690-domain-containing protein [Xylariomycetidae sp. FL0641]